MIVVVLVAVAFLFLTRGAGSGVAVAPEPPMVANAAAAHDPSARAAVWVAMQQMGGPGPTPVYPTNALVAQVARGAPPAPAANPPAVRDLTLLSRSFVVTGLPLRSSGGGWVGR